MNDPQSPQFILYEIERKTVYVLASRGMGYSSLDFDSVLLDQHVMTPVPPEKQVLVPSRDAAAILLEKLSNCPL